MHCLPLLWRLDPRPDGAAGAALRDAQERLAALGTYPRGEKWIDGIFGQRTEAAVEDLQQRRILTVDGIIGPETWGALYDDSYSAGVLPYEAEVSEAFEDEVRGMARRLQLDSAWLMAIMAFETGGTFDPAEKNRAGSGATGLIQFMPSTAAALLGFPATHEGRAEAIAALEVMSALEQLRYVERYFQPYRGRMESLEDAYMAVLFPAAIARPAGYVLFRRPSLAYRLNSGLDANGDGRVTKWEATRRVRSALDRGLAESATAEVD